MEDRTHIVILTIPIKADSYEKSWSKANTLRHYLDDGMQGEGHLERVENDGISVTVKRTDGTPEWGEET